MKKIFIVVIIILVAVGGEKIFASWIEGGAGGRASGLFGSYAAGGNDIFGIYYNPANLGYIRHWEIGLDYNRLAVGLSDKSVLATGFLGLSIPLRRLQQIREEKIVAISSPTVAAISPGGELVAVSSPTVTLIPELEFKKKIRLYRHSGSIGLAWHSFRLNEEYERNVCYLSYSRPVGEKFVFGLSGKYLQQKYAIDEYLRDSPVFEYGEKNSAGSFSGDAGLIYNPYPQVFIGLSGQDLFSPDMGLAGADKILPAYRFGFAFRSPDVFWEFDYLNEEKKSYYSAGLEKRWSKIFATRCGLGFGQNGYTGIAGGFSFDFYSAALEYGFVLPLTGMKDFLGNHRLSFVYKFGRWHWADIEKGTLEYSYQKMEEELKNYQLQLAKAEAEKEQLKKALTEEATLRIEEKIRVAEEQSGEKIRFRTHLVQPGDTLQGLAVHYLGDAKYWVDIYNANKEKVGRDGQLLPFQILLIPVREVKKPEENIVPEPLPVALPPEVIKATEPVVISTPAAPMLPETTEIRPIPKEKVKKEFPKYNFPLKHMVSPGENLRSLAIKYYNNPERWKDIYENNRDKLIRGNLVPGTEIIIPK